MLLEALSRIQARFPHAVLLLAGDGPELGALQARASELGLRRVRFLGRRSDVLSLHHLADVVACPSTWPEAFGLTIAEAMMNARPVITCDVGGVGELVEHRVSGLVVPPGDPNALGEALATLLASPDLRAQLGRAARGRASQKFRLDHMVGQMLELFGEVIRDGVA